MEIMKRFLSRRNVFSALLFLISFNFIDCAPLSDDTQDLAKLNLEAKLEKLQSQLQNIESQLSGITVKESGSSQSQSYNGKTSALVDKDHIPNGHFLDHPVQPQMRIQERRAGWQPFRRQAPSGNSASDSKGATFFLKLKDSQILQQELIEAVERHLLEDLATAEKYGIQPKTILEHLHNKQHRK